MVFQDDPAGQVVPEYPEQMELMDKMARLGHPVKKVLLELRVTKAQEDIRGFVECQEERVHGDPKVSKASKGWRHQKARVETMVQKETLAVKDL
jgi:hypothetical protein